MKQLPPVPRSLRFRSFTHFANSQVTLPPKDPVLAPGVFGKGVPGPRHFDFSDTPDVPGFNSSLECKDDYTMDGKGAYRAFLAKGVTDSRYTRNRRKPEVSPGIVWRWFYLIDARMLW